MIMHDTVELLEAIGRDATLRRASPGILVRALEAKNASPGLRELVAAGISTSFNSELGLSGDRYVEHHSQTGAHEDEEALLN
jgi:pyruvoyl-dependent arginine decarboxylase (PvlArgDC)